MKPSPKRVGVSVGDVVQVRLALLPGMSAENDPDAKEMTRANFARTDPGTMNEMLVEARKAQKNEGLTLASLSEQLWLHPRRREARVTYADRSSSGVKPLPSGAPGAASSSSVGGLNLEVRTPGSTVMQPAIGHYPLWAQETFRLENVQWFDEEPEDAQDRHVAYPVPESE